MKRKIVSSVIAFLGYILSPFSWWNDLLVNFPISYALAIPIGLLNRSLFLPAFIINYWLTNIVGLLLIHLGVKGFVAKDSPQLTKKELLKTLLFCFLYTSLILVLILTNVLSFPDEWLDKLG